MKWYAARRVSTFTTIPFGGNPAWVVLGVEANESENKLRQLASELNPVSDTVFVFRKSGDAEIGLRFFSKSEEINFSGHGTIAAFYGIEKEDYVTFKEPITLIRQKTRSGTQHIELRVKNGTIERVTVSLPVPQFISLSLDAKQVARLLNIPPAATLESNFPIGVIALSGCTDVIVPIHSCDVLFSMEPNFQLVKNFCDRYHMTGVVAYCYDKKSGHRIANMRHFAPSVGINEDPVSGLASASLGCYMLQHGIIPVQEMTRLVVDQGKVMKREGRVYTHVHTHKHQIMKVSFGGQGVVTFEGRTMMPAG